MIDTLYFPATHFFQRTAQRGLSAEDIGFVLAYGLEIHRAGVVHFVLRAKDIPDECFDEYARLIGTTLLLNKRSWSRPVTAFRASRKRAVKKIRCKAIEDLREFFAPQQPL